MNPNLAKLQPYPFEKLRQLFAGVTPPKELKEIKLSIGEPQHGTPEFIKKALVEGLGGLSAYPATNGSDALRSAIATWIGQRYGIPAPDAATQVLPVTGSREALFAFDELQRANRCDEITRLRLLPTRNLRDSRWRVRDHRFECSRRASGRR